MTYGQFYQLNQLNSPESHFLITTDTAGLLGFAGHRHAILAAEWEAELILDPENLAGSSIRISVQTDSLILDSERAYRLAGFTKKIPPEEARLATLERIRGPDILNVTQNPTLRFVSADAEIMPTEEKGITAVMIAGDLQLRGDLSPAVPVELTVLVERRIDRIVFDGAIEVLQSDFGIQPFSLAGVVRVKDQIRLTWHLELPL
ncbi:MAG: YceI family protein [Gammaproteobacteria bacterium]